MNREDLPEIPKIRDPRFEVRVSMKGQYWMGLDQEEELVTYLAPRIAKMIKRDYLKWVPKDYITEKEWKVRWRGVSNIQKRVEECLDLMPSWRLRWAFEAGVAESLLTLAKRHPDEFSDILAKAFYGNAALSE